MENAYNEKTYKVLQKMDIRQEKDDKTKDALLKQVYTGIAGAVATSSFALGVPTLAAGIGAGAAGAIALGGLGVAGGVIAGGIAIKNLVGVIKSLRDRKKADKQLQALNAEPEVVEEGRGMGL